MPKKSLRRIMLARRAALGHDAWRDLSQELQARFLATRHFRESKILALYAAVNGEADTMVVLRAALAAGKEVLLPAVEGHRLRFHQVNGEADLVPGAFGILEPCQGCRERTPHEADCIVIPGVAFDLSGRRIGYGKGFYDRALHRLEGSGRLVGFCFEFQLVDEIVGELHDVALDLIITEQRTVAVRNI